MIDIAVDEEIQDKGYRANGDKGMDDPLDVFGVIENVGVDLWLQIGRASGRERG